MERVTQKDECGYYLVGDGIYGDWGTPEKFRGDDVDRLAAIEDILGDEYDLDRLRELVEADREQRCFVFMFGFGSTVYRTWIHPSGSPTFITENKMDTLNDLLNAETWDNAYSTRAEAEAALRREQE